MINKNEDENKKYARSPYNFIPFPGKIFYRHTILENYIDEDKGLTILPKHNKFREDLKTGYIDYSIEVETPLFISNGENGFFEVNGKYTIPGSTVRGKIRSNCEILSCSYPEFIEDKKLWYREIFSKDILKEMYSEQVLSGEKGKINEKVEAGYLRREGDKWFVTPAERYNNKSFREIHECELRCKYRVIDEDIKKNMFMYKFKDEHSNKLLWNAFYEKKNEKKRISKEIDENDLTKDEIKKLRNEQLQIDKKIRKLLKDNKINKFKPYYYRVSYDLKEDNSLEITKVVKSTRDESYGFLMNSSRLNFKQNHYLIFKKDTNKEKKEISKELINQYKTNVRYRQDEEVENFKINDDNDFKNGEEKPIFYFTDKEENIISFGFTPYLKIPYRKSIIDGIKASRQNFEQIKQGKIDYSKGIFGFTNFKYNGESISYKGRVSFTNAKSIKSCKQEKKPILKHLMSPKTSSFQLYLKQDINDPKKLKTYSNDDFELRGKKFYWLRDKHDNVDDYETDMKEYEDENNKRKEMPKKEQYAKLHPVDKKEVFKGRIYFENLYVDELGLVLMSIKPFEDAKENLGQGKPYGYGKVNFKIEDIVEINSKERFTSIDSELSQKSTIKNKSNYIDEFKNYMRKQSIKVDFDNELMYKCFYQSKLQEKNIYDREFNYMEIKEFTDRKILKPMNEYIDKKNIPIQEHMELDGGLTK